MVTIKGKINIYVSYNSYQKVMWLKTIFKVLENNTVIQIELISMTK